MNDDILWKIDSEIVKDKKVVELNRIITKLEEDNTCLRKALKTYEEGRYQEHLENEQLHSIIKEVRGYITNQKLHKIVDTTSGLTYEERKLLEILDKVEESK